MASKSSVAASPGKAKMTKKGGLEALFDYSRVAPTIAFEDSDEDDLQIIDKFPGITGRKSAPLQAVQSNIETRTQAPGIKKVESEEDWLAPPTRTASRRIHPEDPHLLKIRQQKEELLKLSARMAVESSAQSAMEAEAKRASCQLSSDDCMEIENPKGVDSQNMRAKVVLQLQEDGGKTHPVKIYLDDKFEKLFVIYAEKIAKRPVTDFIFRFDGEALDPRKTPKQLELEDEDMIEVFVKPTSSSKR